MKRLAQQGFTLIELMIVMTIIGILAATALPAYQDYTIKARVSEVIMATSPCRAAVSEVYQTGTLGSPPGINGWGCEIVAVAPSKYVASITTDANGVITVLTSAGDFGSATAKTITLTPQRSDGTAKTWAAGDVGVTVGHFRCAPGGAAPMPDKYLPRSCV